MDRDHGRGILNKALGSLKKGVGRLTGDRKTQAEGHRLRARFRTPSGA